MSLSQSAKDELALSNFTEGDVRRVLEGATDGDLGVKHYLLSADGTVALYAVRTADEFLHDKFEVDAQPFLPSLFNSENSYNLRKQYAPAPIASAGSSAGVLPPNARYVGPEMYRHLLRMTPRLLELIAAANANPSDSREYYTSVDGTSDRFFVTANRPTHSTMVVLDINDTRDPGRRSWHEFVKLGGRARGQKRASTRRRRTVTRKRKHGTRRAKASSSRRRR